MPWWGRTKQDSKKKSIAEGGVFDAGQRPRYPRQPKRIAEDDGSSRASRKSLDVASEPGSASGVGSRSPSPSSPSNECCPGPGQPLPLPCAPPRKKGIEYGQSGTQSVSTRLQVTALRHAPSMPLPSPTQVQPRPVVESSGEVDSGSVSSASSLGSIDAVDQWQPGRVSNLRPLQDDPPEQPHPSTSQMGQELSTLKHQQPLRQESSRSTSPLLSSHQPAVSPNRRQVRGSLRHGEGSRPQYLNIPPPDSSISSPAPSPRSFLAAQRNVEPVVAGSGQSSSPRSAATSAYNSSQGDPALVSQQAEEPSPAPSPRLRSPGPSCGTSATVSPLHPRAGRLGSLGPEQQTTWHEEPRGQYPPQPLPLPPPPTNGTTLYPPVPMSSAPSPSAITPRGTSRALDPSGPGATTRWQKGKLLGSGTFGNVYVGFNNDSGGFCAMKEVLLVSDDSKSNESVKQLSQEIALLSKLRHENIVQYIGTETLEDRLYIYLEYVSGGSIHKLLQEYGAFKEPVTRNYTRQILSGLAYLHNQNTVHRDIKGANILVDTHGIVKLADFGMAKHITAQSFLQSFKGSPYWMAPEVIKQSGGYDLAVDIWSLGCTVLEMVTTKPPWHQYEGVAAMFKIWNSKELPVIPDVLSKEGKDFVRLCLQRNPAHRPSAAQLLEHPFVEDAPRVSGPDVHGSSSDLLSSAATRIQSLNVTPNLGHRLSSSHDVEGPASHVRGRVQQSPTRSREPLSHGHGASVASPSASPRIQSRTVHQMYSGVSTPMMSSGSSTPRGGANGSSPPLLNAVYGALSTFPNGGGYGNDSWTQSGRFTSSSNTHGGGRFQWSITPQRTPEGSPRRQDWHPVDDIPLDLTVGRNNQRMIGKYNAKEMEL